MTCAQVEDEIDAVASGEQPAGEDFRRHVEGCVHCASGLAAARRVEALLATRPAPSAPARFTAAVASRIRSDRWRSEQQVDRVFNAILICGLLIVVVGIAALLNVSAGAAAAARAVEFLARSGQRPAETPAPSLVTYLAGLGFFGTALAMWWWAERRFST
ncbi:MAG TPA: hypothetical protein VNR64_01245 [Vicinamibacterales bacterium]|nr:hypothetical protein [Vicinamibacterales bacterium]